MPRVSTSQIQVKGSKTLTGEYTHCVALNMILCPGLSLHDCMVIIIFSKGAASLETTSDTISWEQGGSTSASSMH